MLHEATGAKRSPKGTSIVDIPVGLTIVLVVLFIPLISLASLTLRSTILNAVMRDAAHHAAKARTFSRPSENERSATTAAESALRSSLSSFPGLSLTNIDVDIIASSQTAQQTIRFEDKLPAAADTSQFIYLIDVTATAEITPLIQADERLLGAIPGVTTPMSLTVSATQIAEHTEGLNE